MMTLQPVLIINVLSDGIMSAREVVLRVLKHIFDQLIPGYLEVLNAISRNRYGLDVVDLMLTSPCKLYELLREHYGSEAVADFMMKIFLRSLIPVSTQFMVEDILKHIKGCNDDIVKRVIYEGLQRRTEEELD